MIAPLSEIKAKTYYIAGSVFLLAVGFFLVKISRDALFIQERGLFDLPKAYLGIGILAGPLAAISLTMMRFLGPRPTRLIISVLVSLALVVFSFFIRPGGGLLMTGFFVFVPLVWGILYSMSWLLAGELLDGLPRHQLAQSYGLIGGAAISGGLLAGVLARALAPILQPNQLLWLAASMVLASGTILRLAQNRWAARMAPSGPSGPSGKPSMSHGLTAVLKSRLGQLMLGVGMAAGLVGVLLEFQFYLVAASGGETGEKNTAFFANIAIILNGAALLFQVMMLPRLQKWVGIGGSLLVLPLVLSGGIAALFSGISLWGISTLRVTEGGLKSSLHRANWEQTYLLLSGPMRSSSKFLIDGFAVRMAEGFAAGMLFWWLMQFSTVTEVVAGGISRILPILFACSVVWLVFSWLLHKNIQSRLKTGDELGELTLDGPLPDG